MVISGRRPELSIYLPTPGVFNGRNSTENKKTKTKQKKHFYPAGGLIALSPANRNDYAEPIGRLLQVGTDGRFATCKHLAVVTKLRVPEHQG